MNAPLSDAAQMLADATGSARPQDESPQPDLPKEDEWEAKVQENVMEGAALHRMTAPAPAEEVALMGVCSLSFAACLVAAMTA